MANASANMTTMPAGSVAPVDSLIGDHSVKITAIYTNNEFEVEYPGDFHRSHQADSIQALLPKIVNNLRARYGVDSVKFTEVPETIKEGAVIEFTV